MQPVCTTGSQHHGACRQRPAQLLPLSHMHGAPFPPRRGLVKRRCLSVPISCLLTLRFGKQQQKVSFQLKRVLAKASLSSTRSWSSMCCRILADSACWNASCFARSSASQVARSASACGDRPTVKGAVLPATCSPAGFSLLPARQNTAHVHGQRMGC